MQFEFAVFSGFALSLKLLRQHGSWSSGERAPNQPETDMNTCAPSRLESYHKNESWSLKSTEYFILYVNFCQSKSSAHRHSMDGHIQCHKIRQHLFNLAEIIAFSDRAEEFKKLNCQAIGASVHSYFGHLAWFSTPKKQGGLGPMNIPLVSDSKHTIAQDYGVLKADEEENHRTSLFQEFGSASACLALDLEACIANKASGKCEAYL
ncbi:uncharacterized protein LOC129692024 [Psammomys obesus]|uniref:uncharacterized protein LOC129692024 n=1 Tax=Psammomys obesus TaxID=48139 RepID=UPI002452AB49|nr:uncharacterized protein LOC129692024 [Psammomys obesus]